MMLTNGKDITKFHPGRFNTDNSRDVSSNKLWDIQEWDFKSPKDNKDYRVTVQIPKVNTREMETELKIRNCISHKNIIQLYGSVEYNKLTCYVFETSKYDSLQEVVVDKTVSLPYKDSDKLRWLIDAAGGLVYLHTELDTPIYCDNLRSSNIRLCATDEGIVAKLTDFGSAQMYSSSSSHGSKDKNCLWDAPEFLSQRKKNDKSDVWSFGAIVVEVFIEDHPYRRLISEGHKIYKIIKGIIKGEYDPLKSAAPSDLEKIPPEVKEHLVHCFYLDANMRWTMKQIHGTLKELLPATAGRNSPQSPCE